MREAFKSLRARVLLLIAVPFAVMLSMTVYHELRDREDRLALAKQHVLDAARVMAGEQQVIIEHVHQVMLSAALLPDVSRGVASEDCNRTLAAILQQEPSLANIALANSNGDVICNAIPTAKRISIADRDHFKGPMQERKFAVGGYVISRSTGKASLGIGLPLLDEAGVPRTLIAVSLNLAWLKQELDKAQLPEGSRVVMVDWKGTVLGRHPDPEGLVGRTVAELPLLETILSTGGEGIAEDIGLDGRRRIFGFVPLHRTSGGQTYIWVAVPKDVFVGPADRAFVVSVLVTLAVLVLTFLAAWLGSESLFVRRMAALAGAAEKLGNGNLAIRVASKPSDDEIGRLAQSFDRMAEGLQANVAKLSRAVRALRVQSAGNRAMLREEKGEQHLLDEMCQAIGEAGGYHLAWVGYAEDDAEKSIRPAAHWGSVAKGYFEHVKLTWSDTGSASPGVAIRTGTPVVIRNIQAERGPHPWQDYVLRSGCGSCVALPLRIDDRVIGVLNIYAAESDAFSDEEVGLLSEAAADLSFGIASQRAKLERASMKGALKTAEARFRVAAEESLDALIIAGSVRDTAEHIVDFECTDVNAHAAELLGMAREKIIGQKLCKLLPIMRTGGFLDKYAEVVATGTALEEEFQIDIPELKAKWLRTQVVRVEDGVAIFARDVTLWKESGARLRESEERLRLAITAAHLGVWNWDLKSDRFTLLEGVETIFGLLPGQGSHPPEEVIEAVHPEDREPLARALSDGRENGTPIQLELRTAQSDGTVRWVEAEGTFIRGATGALERGVGIVMDITERKLAEQQLRESEETLRTLAASAQDAILMLDNDGSVAYWNTAAQEIFGYSVEEALGKDMHRLLAPARFHEAFQAGFRHFRSTGDGAVIGKTLELVALRRDGTEFPMELSLSAVKLKGKWNAVGIVRDITQRKAGELALIRSNRALRTLSVCNEALVHAVSEPELLDTTCRRIVDAGGYAMAWVGFSEQNPAKTVRVAAHYGTDEGYLESMNITWADTEQGRGPTGTAIRTGATQVNQSFLTNPSTASWRDAALARGFRSSIALPLNGPSGTLGALMLYAREPDAFNKEEVHFLEELAENLAFGIKTLRTRLERDLMTHAHLHHEEILRKSLEEFIHAISDTLEMRDPYTAGHQRRVSDLAEAIAGELGISKEEIHGIRLAASIHDVGKIRVPAEILSKPGKLSDVEFMLIKAHAQAGYDILKGIAFPWPIADIVLQHHERQDGSGYPQGLKGDHIVSGARILAVADVLEAMASHRPYRPSLGPDAALAEIERGRGTAYEPAVVDACLKLFREKRFAFQT